MASILTALVAGCASPHTAQRSAQGQLLQDAERYVTGLREQNHLPGFSNTEHGRLIAAASWTGGTVAYPTSVTIRAWKEGQQPSYRYQLTKDAQQAPWSLVSATRLDADGKVVEELLPK